MRHLVIMAAGTGGHIIPGLAAVSYPHLTPPTNREVALTGCPVYFIKKTRHLKHNTTTRLLE